VLNKLQASYEDASGADALHDGYLYEVVGNRLRKIEKQIFLSKLR
jgi:hypothetical protein